MCMVRREAGLAGELIAGHADRAKVRWVTAEAAAELFFQSTVPTQQSPELPLGFQPCCPVSFLNM